MCETFSDMNEMDKVSFPLYEDKSMSARAHEDEDPYGCCRRRPKYMQCMNNVRSHVVWQCAFAFFEGFIVNGIINVIIVALETRYALSSALSGFIASSNDIGGLLVLLPVSYFGEHRHKPRIMAAGIFIMALGSLVFAGPHFIGGRYEYTVSENKNDSFNNMCKTSPSSPDTCAVGSQSNASPLYAMFVIGQILLGIGACPTFTIGLSYIDENTTSKMTSFYTGWIYAFAAVGVAAGYVVGGQTLRIFVDVDRVDPQSVQLTPLDPQWVGAWWIGALISLVVFLLIAFPFLGYPRRLPGYNALQLNRKSEAHCDGAEELTARQGFGENIKDFPKAVFLLVRNPAYVFICLGTTMEALIFGGTATFGAKIIQQRFQANIATAGLIMGIITVPGAGGGMLLGGYIVKRFNLKCRGILRLCACAAAISLLFSPSFLAKCEEKPLMGVTTPYFGQITEDGLTSPCNSRCECTTTGFEPLCVNSSVVYFSPCHAGCTGFTTENGMKVYANCSCLIEDTYANVLNPRHALRMSDEQTLVKPGTCGGTCVWMYVFSVMFFFIMLCTFSTLAPTVSAVFRCVPHNQRSLALGLNLLVARLLGTTPAPVLLGSIIDSTCQVWQDSCGETGSCWVYKKDDMAYKMMAWWVVLKLLSVFFYGLASRVYKAPQKRTPSPELARGKSTNDYS